MTRIRRSLHFLPLLFIGSFAMAADKPKTAPPAETPAQPDAAQTSEPGEGERVNVEKIKEKYWARGDESELGVVQNRLYSKEHKTELALYGGFLTTDPFLSVKNVGLSLGFHFTEYLSAHVLAWKSYASSSSALELIEKPRPEGLETTVNYNKPLSFYGAELKGSVLYGKLSLIGKAIIYYDLHFTGGAGVTKTQTGDNLTLFGGLGQQIFLSKRASLLIDYRLMHFEETIVERVVTSRLGQVNGTRSNWTNAITLGISFLIGGDK